MDQPEGFTPTRCNRDPSRQRMMISQSLNILSNSVRRPQVPNGKTGDMGKHAVVHNQQTSNQETPAEDKSKLVHSRKGRQNPAVLNQASIP